MTGAFVATKQFGRSWWHAYDEKGNFLALGKTSRGAKELALQKLSLGDVRRRPDCLPDVPAHNLGAPASGMSAGTAETASQAQGEARQPDPEGETPISSGEADEAVAAAQAERDIMNEIEERWFREAAELARREGV
jgi:hypothetical protein